MRDDGRKLPKLCERSLIYEPLLGRLALCDVAADREVLPRLAGCVEERHDRRIHPVERAILGAIPDLAAPDAPLRNRAPQIAEELLGMEPGVDDAMVLPYQLFTGVFRDFAELVVDVGDEPTLVRHCDDGGLIEGVLDFLQPLHRELVRATVDSVLLRPPRQSAAVLGNDSGSEPDADEADHTIDGTKLVAAARRCDDDTNGDQN